MAIVASMLRSEMRRHLLMNVSLVASCVVGGTVVTNERGLFVPLNIHGLADAAFVAMFTQSHLLPDNNDLTDVRMASPLDPFEVTADSRDLRRRLMDSLSWLPEQAADYDKELAQVDGQPILPVEVANNVNPGAPVGVAGAPGAAAAAGSAAEAAGAPVTAAAPAAAQQAQQQQTNVLPTSNTSSASTSPAVTPAQAATATTPAATTTPTTDQTVGAVPEPSAWAMLIAGFGMIGYLLRGGTRRRKTETEAA